MAFFHLTLAARNAGSTIKLMIESTAASVTELCAEFDKATEPRFIVATVIRSEARGDHRIWQSREEAIAVSQIALVAQIKDPRFKPPVIVAKLAQNDMSEVA